MKAHQALRAATAPDHDRVDRAFARFALDDPHDYGRFLCAHARALPPVEAALTLAGLPFRARASLLQDDLIDLGEAMPPLLKTGWLSDAEAVGYEGDITRINLHPRKRERLLAKHAAA